MLNRFRSSSRGKGTSIVIWALLGLLIVGLTGLGLGGAVSGIASQNVATVGSEKVEREEYVRQLLQQVNALSQRAGQGFTVQQARAFGLDQQVLAQLVTRAALDGEVDELGLSVTDEMVRDDLVRNPAFQGLSNGFDAQSYEFFLDNSGMSAKDFEEQVRGDLSRGLLEIGVAGGAAMPEVMADTLLAWQNETRRFAVMELSSATLDEAIEDPTDEQLQAFYSEHEDRYTRPETRIVSYAAATPEMMAETIEVSDEAARASYEARADQFNTPERRIVDLIAFGTAEDAQAARDAIDAGETTFNAIAEERGLSADDLSLGAIESEALGSEARAAVFGLDGPGLVGPVQSDLGPGLYRVNAVLAARETSFEEVEGQIRQQLAAADAQDAIIELYDPVQDLLAAGATLEELAEETEMQFGEIGVSDEPGEGLAADTAFRTEAFEAEPGEPRDMIELENGGLAALRVERIDPPQVIPFDEVRDRVAEDWRAAETQAQLLARAEALKAQLDEGQTITRVSEESGVAIERIGPVGRSEQPGAGMPPDLIQTVFDLTMGGSTVLEEPGFAYLVQVTEVRPADTSSPEYAQQRAALQRQLDGALSSEVFDGYAQMVIDGKDVSVNQTLIEETLAQYP